MSDRISPEQLVSTPGAFVILDTRPAGAWAQGHLAGALDADLDRYLSTASDPGFDPADQGRHPLPPLERWARQLGAWGIGPQTPVVVYDGASGAMGACRAWWMLRASGHGSVLVLDGTLEAARMAGMPWTEAPTPAPVPLPPYPVGSWGLAIVDIDQAAAFAADPRRILIDVRAPERWRGEIEPIDPVAGRIPGSVNLFLQKNLTSDGRFRAAEELAELYQPFVQNRSPNTVAVHCGSGVSACHTLFALHEAGFDGAALYVGSFSQWCRSGRPLGRGQA